MLWTLVVLVGLLLMCGVFCLASFGMDLHEHSDIHCVSVYKVFLVLVGLVVALYTCVVKEAHKQL